MQSTLKKILPHILVFVGFMILSLAYFSPVLQGKQILQSDILQYKGMAKQQLDFKAKTGEEAYWTNSAFGGMPTYQLGARYPYTYIKSLDLGLRFLPRPADYLFLYFVGLYILLLCLKIDYKLAILGALAFGFSTYLIIIIGAGHNSKAHAIAYMPLVLSGIILTFRKKYILGFIVTALAMGLELVANHFQMTYYLMFLVIIIGIVYLIDAYKKKVLPHFFKAVGILLAAVILAIGLNATNIMATQEYVKESTRSKSELTINPDGSPRKEISSGLVKYKITEYSYGYWETFNLFIPRFLGGGMREDLGKESAFYKFYRSRNVPPYEASEAAKVIPTYWGDQPIVEAPAYIGAVVLFLFVFALFIVKGRLKWWLVSCSILALLLSYGKNFGLLTDFFINYVPLYDKFRAVTSIQVLLELCVPLLAVFGLARLFNDYEKNENKQKALKYATLITSGLCVLFLIFRYTGTLLSFEGIRDANWAEVRGQDFVDAIVADRKSIFVNDTLRSLVLVLLSATTIYMFLKQKLSDNKAVIVFALLIVFDLVGVDRRYVNTENFVSSREVQTPFQPNEADKLILSEPGHFRVYDVSSGGGRAISQKVDDMTNGGNSAPYFHNTINGYHAAKPKRFDELSDFYEFTRHIEILNMLNVKYIISEDESNESYPFLNSDINGNAWFVETLTALNSADEEIVSLADLNTKKDAVTTDYLSVDFIKNKFIVDSLASIKVTEYQPNYIKYESENKNDGYAVFSEMYYKNGWDVYIDNQKSNYNRVDYLLRGMEIPKGNHVVEFKFEPQVVKTGSSITLASSIIFMLIVLGGLFFNFRRKQ
ncbi:YfhO family protein [Lacinutrix jangbogonensis]|uniref:YfhO family protein n=1 Tax=Lacinutrix jangbogonensis TaxID=1469557 RepID=UPI00053D79DC|nr:YfhO family protein [Lacinutrix jangbogonensis]